MKTILIKSALTKMALGVLFLGLLLPMQSCSKKVQFENSPVVPAARGDVKISKNSNKNYGIKIKFDNLAEVDRLDPPKKTYVIWMVTDQQSTKNIGQVKSGSSMMSSKLKADFETATPFKPVKIFVTAEDDGNVEYPGMYTILSTSNF
ncbi:hypothetical protein [Flavobacterium sp.]|jgi:hypothetical protein|uniref:hypothetical protein n=1 Tax=Flavobacterium sp. TaxID=239 RepID=UPI0037C16D9B